MYRKINLLPKFHISSVTFQHNYPFDLDICHTGRQAFQFPLRRTLPPVKWDRSSRCIIQNPCLSPMTIFFKKKHLADSSMIVRCTKTFCLQISNDTSELTFGGWIVEGMFSRRQINSKWSRTFSNGWGYGRRDAQSSVCIVASSRLTRYFPIGGWKKNSSHLK